MKKRIGARKEKSDCEPEELCFLAKEFDELTERVSQSKPLPGGHTEEVLWQ